MIRNPLQTKGAVMAILIHRVGFRLAGQLIELIDDWRDCCTAHGGPVGFEDYVHWTRRYSRATAYRRLGLFRQTFPELGPRGTPEGLLGPLLDRLAAEEVAEVD